MLERSRPVWAGRGARLVTREEKDEQVFNLRFAEAVLRASGWEEDWVFKDDRRVGDLFAGSRRKPDLLLTLPASPPLVVECKYSDSAGDPVEDARRELGLVLSEKAGRAAGQKIAKALAVRYPEGADAWRNGEIAERFLSGEPIRWKYVEGESPDSYDTWPRNGYLEGTVAEFASSAADASADVDGILETGATVAALIRGAAAAMLGVLQHHPQEIERISALMGAPGLPEVGMRVACVVWFDSLLIMNELALAGRTEDSTDSCRSNGHLHPGKVATVWDRILDVNYRSAFRLAADSFPRVVSAPALRAPFQLLDEAVGKVEMSLLGKAANIGGEVFAQVMEEGARKRSASFYTNPENAEFLAYATLPSRNDLPDKWREWRIGDFACGTGTLLRAGYRRLRQFAAADEVPLNRFHLHMMEEGLCGLDISPIAVHLTAAGIVGLYPQSIYLDTNIGGMSFGKVKPEATKIQEVLAGSVELLDYTKARQQLMTTDFSPMRGEQTESDNDITVLKAADFSFDAVLMNPPYSRTRGGQAAFDLSGIDEEERRLIQKRVRNKLIKGTCGSMKAGLDTVFAAVADRKLRPGGRVGLVLPLTAAASGAYIKMRKMFERDYREVTVVTIGGGRSISADTGMEEMMLLARKGRTGREGVAYVYIDEPFFSTNAAAETARVMTAVLSDAEPGEWGVLVVGGDQVGRWYVAHPTGEGRPWGGAGIENLLVLYPAADNLTAGVVNLELLSEPVKFPVVAIGDLFEVGPTHHLIGHTFNTDPIGAFTFYERDPGRPGRDSKHLALWSSSAADQTSVLVRPTHYGVPYRKAESERQAAYKTDLFYQRGMRWTSQAILVAATDGPALGGSAWAPLRGNTELVRFAFAVWANSIFGFVNHWTVTQRQHKGRNRAQIGDIGRIPCPDFADPAFTIRAQRHISRRAELFDLQLDRAMHAYLDRERRQLDLAAADILGIPENYQLEVAHWFADRWSEEPKVSNSAAAPRPEPALVCR